MSNEIYYNPYVIYQQLPNCRKKNSSVIEAANKQRLKILKDLKDRPIKSPFMKSENDNVPSDKPIKEPFLTPRKG